MTMAMELIRHIAGLYSGKAIKGDFTQVYITGNEIWMAQQILAEQAEGAQGEREALPYWEPCNPGCDPEFNGERSRYCAQLCHNARAALAQPSRKCATCNGAGRICVEPYPFESYEDCQECAQPSPAPEHFTHSDKKLEALLNATALLIESPGHDAAHYWTECLREYDEAHSPAPELKCPEQVGKCPEVYPELERPEALDIKPYHHHAEKIRQRVEEAASVYEAGGSALGYMEDIAESALIVRNGLDELSDQNKRWKEQFACMQLQRDHHRDRADAAQARVVVVPERIPAVYERGIDDPGFNACLDELARLNGKVVSEGLLRDLLKSAQKLSDRAAGFAVSGVEFIEIGDNNSAIVELEVTLDELRALLDEGKENGHA